MLRRLATLLAPLLLATGAAASGSPLISAHELAAREGATVVDIRPAEAFAAGHIPGAVNAPYPTWRGPADNPGEPLSDAALTERLNSLGLGTQSRVVVAHAGADASDFGAAARVYWTLKSAGLTDLAILNGGVAAWGAEDLALSTDARAITRSHEQFSLSGEWSADASDVAAIQMGARTGRLLDARPAAFFEGATKHPAAPASGTIAGAQSLPFLAWFDGESAQMGDEAAARAIAERAAGNGGGGDMVSFCNTGHWAAINWFALSELAGQDDVKLYPESVVGWQRDGGDVVSGAKQ